MPTFIRRMLEGTAMLRQPEGEGGTPEPEAGATNAGGDTGEPEAGSPSAEPGTAAEGTGEAVASDPAASTGAPPAAQTPEQLAAQQRTNRLVAERWAERRRAEAAEQQSRLLQEQLNQTRQALQTQPQVDADGNPLPPQQQRPAQPPQQDLQAMAAQIAAQNDFNRQVEAEVLRGRGVHQDFDQVAATLQQFGELPRTFVEAALATGKGAEVMYALGKDALEANRILSMPLMAQAVALAQLAGTLKAPEPPKKVTSAAAPIVPKIGGGSGKNTPSLDDPNMPVADWIKLREKNLPKRASR